MVYLQNRILKRFYYLSMSDHETFEYQSIELADLGLSHTDRVLLKKEIWNLRWSSKECHAHGFFKNVRQFWHKHHKAILAAAAIAAVAAIVAVVIGAAAGAAAAAGGAALQPNEKDKDDKDKNTFDAPEKNLSVKPVNGNCPNTADSPATIAKEIENHTSSDNALTKLIDDGNQPKNKTLFLTSPVSIAPGESQFSEQTTPSIEMIPHFANQHKPTSLDRELPRIGSEDQGVIYIHCGINNDPSTVNNSGTTLYNELHKAYAIQPNLTHNDGIAHGLAMVLLEKVSQPSLANVFVQGPLLPAIEQKFLENSAVQESINRRAKEMAIVAEQIINENNPKLKQVHVAFSNGGYVIKEALKQLPPEYQQTVVVITAGTTATLENGSACQVYDLIGSKDWPSKVCNGGKTGIQEASETATIIPVKQTETQFLIGGHYFTQPEYLEKIADLITKKIATEYEISK